MQASPVVDYYDALEQALSDLTRVFGEYRRHFGCSRTPPPAGYCWFKAVASPERHPDYAKFISSSLDQLENRILSELPRLQPESVLDVGCGNGALLRRLARELPHASLLGLNFQPAQVRTARRHLQGTHAEVVEANFLDYRLDQRFALVCLLESAFHIRNKDALFQRLAQAVVPGGEIWLLDIVVSERAASTFGSVGRGEALFSYLPREAWRRGLGEYGIDELEFADLSCPVAEFLQISDIDALRDECFVRSYEAPPHEEALRDRRPDLATYVKLMTQVATQYRRLSRLLQAGMLQYVLMRYRARSPF